MVESKEALKQSWPERYARTIPGGASTLSKVPQLLPEEPEVITRGDGCRIWDSEGKEYIDFRNGLGPVTLGYRFPEVDDAIREQLNSGISFGHPHSLEIEVAEMLGEAVPCAEMVRFLKTGGEAVAACIRLARHYTSRDHIIQIGYNGWINSLSSEGQVLPGQNRSSDAPGVPRALGLLHHSVKWNDAAGLKHVFERFPDQIAAVVVAADYADMKAGKTFYPEVRELTDRFGSLLIFDEIVTGFRIALGGVQEHFQVTPDLAIFSKAIANGMPLSAFMGRKEIMQNCGRGGVTVSSTFGGETLSLAAAKATLTVYQKQDVIGHLWKQGEKLWSTLNSYFTEFNIPLKLQGYWPCPVFELLSKNDAPVLERFFRLAYRNGLSLYNVPYINFSHLDRDIEQALKKFKAVCEQLAQGEG